MPPILPTAALGSHEPAERVIGLLTPTGWVKGGALLASFVILFHFFLTSQHLYSFGSGDWSHAYIVPFISVYLLWQKRDAILAITPVTYWPGVLPILVGIPAYALFQIGSLSNHMAQGWSMILCIFGVVLLTCGPQITRLAFLPIAYLVFGITISEKIMILVTFQLQLIASQGAWAVLNIGGISADVFGNVLRVVGPDGVEHDLNVAEACSGMRMVIAFAALGVAVALVGVNQWWQRTALLCLAVPVAVLMNVLRVAVLGFLTLYDANLAAGQAHMLIGTLLLVPAFLLYLGMVWVLNRLVVVEGPTAQSLPSKSKTGKPGSAKAKLNKAQPTVASTSASKAEAASGIRWPRLTQPSFVVALAVLLGAAAGLSATVQLMGVHLRKQAIQPPDDRRVQAVATETTNWTRVGQDHIMSPDVVTELGTSNYLQRTYTRKNTKPGDVPVRLDLHLAYYTGMIDTVPHVQERCMTGAGWQIVGLPRALPLNLSAAPWTLDATVPESQRGQIYTARLDPIFSRDAATDRVRLPRDPKNISILVTEFVGPRQAKLIGGYFFIANGGHVGNAEGVRTLAFDMTDDYAFYLKVQVSSSTTQSPEALAAATSDLLGELLPEIMRCVPDWVEVQAGRYPADNPRRAKAEAAAVPTRADK